MTITWTDKERLHLIRIIAEQIMRSDNRWENNERAHLVVVLACWESRHLEINRSKFAEAIAEYDKENAE